MTIIDRNRVAQLDALATAERTLEGPERSMREAEVATLIKAAYDDATDQARAEFMAKVKPLPVATWPWSAVRSGTPRASVVNYQFEPNVLLGKAPTPAASSAPPVLILIMGQAPTTEPSAGNEVPDRLSTAGQAWAPLYKALDTWNTPVINAWISPTGWMDPTGVATSGAPAGGESSGEPAGTVDPAAAVAVPSRWPTWAPMAAAAAGVFVLATGLTIAVTRVSDARRLERKLGVG